ncbi:MAG: glycosyltransferase [Thermincolia bacterium]
MKIALVTPGNKPLPPYPCSSIEIYLSHLAKELAGRHRVSLYGKISPKQVNNSTSLRIKPIASGNYLQQVIQDKIKYPSLQLWIVGGKPQPKKNPFHQKILTLAKGLPIRFFPLLPHGKMHGFYLATDLFVCPSQLPEAFGMVNIEAASCGLPSVGSNAWGIRESIAPPRKSEP